MSEDRRTPIDINKTFKDILAEKKRRLVEGPKVWAREPVTPKVFFTEWMKTPPYPKQQEAMDALLVEEADPKVWSTKFNEAYLLWGMGSGKDFTASRIMTYCIYWLLCLENPQGYFRLGEKAAIDLVNVSFNEDQAQFVYFAELKKSLNSVINPETGKKWFEEQGMQIKETSKSQMIQFKKYITAYSLNSKEYQMEGKNVLIAVFDEIAAFKVGKADEIFKNLKGNMRSRFPKEHKLICISYKRDDYDYMMIRWKATEKNPKVFRSGPYATWDVNERVTRADFNEAYETNPEDAERRYECKGSTLKSGFFKYRDRIQEMVNKGRVSPEVEGKYCIKNIKSILLSDWFVGQPNAEYAIHVDLAKGLDNEDGNADCAGFAMGHLEYRPVEKTKKKKDEHDNIIEEKVMEIDEDKPTVVIDLMLQIKAEEKGKEIIFEHIREFIYYLRDERRFNIAHASLDGYQSTDFMQQLTNKGIKTELTSVDTTTGPYDTLKGLLYQGRLDYYFHPVFIRECEELRVVSGKIDHPEVSKRRGMEEDGDERGSKDVSDSVAGIVADLIAAPKKPRTGFVPLTDSEDDDDGRYESVGGQSEYDRDYGDSYKISDGEDD